MLFLTKKKENVSLTEKFIETFSDKLQIKKHEHEIDKIREKLLEEQDEIENICPIHKIYCPDCFCEACINEGKR
ncbi:hypothetical protein A3K62_02555 [Candidatus Pacearchaeota archaeon RBG_16_35_8]|nr:MAG: hypothetical protein A3K62_02555 [Candidatus Pacearchaeota archaeon RBG_16_35_8]HJZ23639.1 hypothetical protein [Candidatus Babeliales bacterium]